MFIVILTLQKHASSSSVHTGEGTTKTACWLYYVMLGITLKGLVYFEHFEVGGRFIMHSHDTLTWPLTFLSFIIKNLYSYIFSSFVLISTTQLLI